MATDFSESLLGTKEYWEEAFALELKNFQETKDVGEIWFGDDSVERVIDWITSNDQSVSKDAAILDIGCGNGIMLVELAKNGFSRLFGIDYVQNAINLAKAVASEENVNIVYEAGNILDELPDSVPEDSSLHRRYDVCLDKGTYDAVSLNPVDPAMQRSRYLNGVKWLCRHGGLFIITSCNWTEEELMSHFGSDFDLVYKIPTPTFQFGGKTGNRETVLVLKRKSDSIND